jgi:lipopolysaccharide cholinephosphotransferase
MSALAGNNSQQLKDTQLNLLKDFIIFCKKNKLRYYLVYGSALGAVRHHGFIPWDDDIDVGMPRNDYEKFIELWGVSRTNKQLFLQTSKTDPHFPLLYAKLRLNGSLFLESYFKHLAMHHGIFIDIFPFDGVAENKFQRMYSRIMVRSLKRLIISKLEIRGKNLFFELLLFLISRIIPMRVLSKMAKKIVTAHRYDESRKVSCLVEDQIPVDRSVFGVGKIGEFEEMSVVLPSNVEEYLTMMYGDYMSIPKVSERLCHAVDEISFKNKL